MKASVLPLFACSVLFAASARGESWVSGAPDRADPVSYAVGDEVVWTFRAKGLPPSAAGRPVGWSWTVAGDGPAVAGTAPFVPGAPLAVTNSFAAPGFLRAAATLVDAQTGKALRVPGGIAAGAAGAGAAPAELAPPEEPADFDAFWAAAKAEALDPARPSGALQPPPDDAARGAPGYRVATFLVPLGPGRAPATGWVSWPSRANPKSLPAVVRFADYGLGPESFPGDFERDALFVLVHPHGFPADMPREARVAAFNAVSNGGRGGAYGFRDEENARPETCYFRGMVQRALAAVRFARTLPMWDGERLTLAGRGQGAFQAVACAALLDGDEAPTFLRLSAPWLCGLGLDTSWQPSFQPSLRYFDTVNFARRVAVPAQIEADLLDTAHSPAGAARLYNALGGPKRLVFRQGDGSEPVATLEANSSPAPER